MTLHRCWMMPSDAWRFSMVSKHECCTMTSHFLSCLRYLMYPHAMMPLVGSRSDCPDHPRKGGRGTKTQSLSNVSGAEMVDDNMICIYIYAYLFYIYIYMHIYTYHGKFTYVYKHCLWTMICNDHISSFSPGVPAPVQEWGTFKQQPMRNNQ